MQCESLNLLLPTHGPGGTDLQWSAPLQPGASAWTYEVLRSTLAVDFEAAGVCLTLADPALPMGLDNEVPLDLFHYLVRAINDCPNNVGQGSLGQGTNGGRSGLTCP